LADCSFHGDRLTGKEPVERSVCQLRTSHHLRRNSPSTVFNKSFTPNDVLLAMTTEAIPLEG
jgi:hypothetical protein